jgi:hypothetical protein
MKRALLVRPFRWSFLIQKRPLVSKNAREAAEKMKENLAVDVMLLTWMHLQQLSAR